MCSLRCLTQTQSGHTAKLHFWKCQMSSMPDWLEKITEICELQNLQWLYLKLTDTVSTSFLDVILVLSNFINNSGLYLLSRPLRIKLTFSVWDANKQSSFIQLQSTILLSWLVFVLWNDELTRLHFLAPLWSYLFPITYENVFLKDK